MKSIKKILFMIIIFSTVFVLFINDTNAEENNTTMIIDCNNLKEAEGIYGLATVEEVIFYKVTDEDGNDYFKGITSLENIKVGSWIKNSDEKEINIDSAFNDGICPVAAVINPNAWTLVGTKQNYKNIVKLEKSRYIAYSFTFLNKEFKVIEGYSSQGKYGYIGIALELTGINTSIVEQLITDSVTAHQEALITKVGDKYFKVDEYFPSILIAGNGNVKSFPVCQNLTEEECRKKYNYEVIISSSESGKNKLKEKISKWLNDKNNKQLEEYNEIVSLTEDESFINTCNEIKEYNDSNNNYDLNKINNIDAFIDKLSKGYDALNTAYDVSFEDCATSKNTSVTSSITSCLVYSELLGISEIADLSYKSNSFKTNENFLVDIIYSSVKEELKEILQSKGYKINLVDVSSDLNKYTELFYTAALYINTQIKRNNISLTETQQKKVENIINNFKNMVETRELGIYPVTDCDTLLGDDLINKIKSYVNIIKIAVPIILLAFGIFDFTKAIFVGEDEMEKAKKRFIKRIFIAILIFITPTIINLLLQIANKVWTVVSPDSCGIF